MNYLNQLVRSNNLERRNEITTQTEILTWHLLNDEKPKDNNFYLIKFSGQWTVRIYYWNGTKFTNTYNKHELYFEVIAWAEMPKGWKEE